MTAVRCCPVPRGSAGPARFDATGGDPLCSEWTWRSSRLATGTSPSESWRR
jgi:hypothetical protein